MMKFILIIGALTFLITGCGPKRMAVSLTPAGQSVAYIGKDLAMALPGRPLDRCKILGHLTMYQNVTPRSFMLFDDLKNALRNSTAEQGGNFVVYIGAQHYVMVGSMPVTNYTDITGIMMKCEKDSLDAAGVNNIIEKAIETEETKNLFDKGERKSKPEGAVF